MFFYVASTSTSEYFTCTNYPPYALCEVKNKENPLKLNWPEMKP